MSPSVAPRKIRVMVADDHAVVRRGLIALIADCEDLEVVAEVGRGDELIATLARVGCEVLVLDLSVARSVDAAFPRIREAAPHTAVLMLTVIADPSVVQGVLAQGARGYLTKDAEPESILDAIRAVAAGEQVVPDTFIPSHAGSREPHERLSPREREVFALVLAHRSPGEIAVDLDLTPSTVSTLLGRIKKKLGARTVPDLVGYAHRVGLVTGEGARPTPERSRPRSS